jgi:hypothetical protein
MMTTMFSDLLYSFGKGPGFVMFGFLQTLLAAWLLKTGIGGAEIGFAFGPIAVALYGAGAWKASAEAKNGG